MDIDWSVGTVSAGIAFEREFHCLNERARRPQDRSAKDGSNDTERPLPTATLTSAASSLQSCIFCDSVLKTVAIIKRNMTTWNDT